MIKIRKIVETRRAASSCNGRRVIADDTQSRRDETLLTVDFNLRKMIDIRSLQSPAGTTHGKGDQVPSLRDLVAVCSIFVRRLKPTVNRVSSLRDFSSFLWSLNAVEA